MSNTELISVLELPLKEIPQNTKFSIQSNGITDFTHGFFKYPCKFIPHIPRWAINRYLGEKDGAVLDPFCGSGTALVEAVLRGKVALGIDYDPFSQLLSTVKSTPLTKRELEILGGFSDFLKKIKSGKVRIGLPPEIPNIHLWFTEKAIKELNYLRWGIKEYTEKTGNKNKVENFLKICLGAIIRKVSLADDQSPKPYVCKKLEKEPAPVFKTFEETFRRHLERIIHFSKIAIGKGAIIVGSDAREIHKDAIKRYTFHGIDLAITSPPYINAFDYSRTLKLENFWLDLLTPEKMAEYRKFQIGTEFIPSNKYNGHPPISNIADLNPLLQKIYRQDRKRAYVVHTFFEDIRRNMKAVFDCLKKGGVYCIVIGESRIRNEIVPTPNIIVELGKEIGFKVDVIFSYIIKNRYLHFPRNGRGGYIKYDWVIGLKK